MQPSKHQRNGQRQCTQDRSPCSTPPSIIHGRSMSRWRISHPATATSNDAAKPRQREDQRRLALRLRPVRPHRHRRPRQQHHQTIRQHLCANRADIPAASAANDRLNPKIVSICATWLTTKNSIATARITISRFSASNAGRCPLPHRIRRHIGRHRRSRRDDARRLGKDRDAEEQRRTRPPGNAAPRPAAPATPTAARAAPAGRTPQSSPAPARPDRAGSTAGSRAPAE